MKLDFKQKWVKTLEDLSVPIFASISAVRGDDDAEETFRDRLHYLETFRRPLVRDL